MEGTVVVNGYASAPTTEKETIVTQGQDVGTSMHRPTNIMATATATNEKSREVLLKEFASHLEAHSLHSNKTHAGNNNSNISSMSTHQLYRPGSAAAMAAARMAGKVPTKMTESASVSAAFAASAVALETSQQQRILRCLHRDTEGIGENFFTGGAVVSLPGLDVHSVVDMDTTQTRDNSTADSSSSSLNNLIPAIGSSHLRSATNASTGDTSNNDSGETNGKSNMPPPSGSSSSGNLLLEKNRVKIPPMAASVFVESTNPNVSATESAASANADAQKLEQLAARTLGARTTWTRSTAAQAPKGMLSNLHRSFSSLVDSRVRAWTLLLLRQSLSSGDEASRSRLLHLLATSSTIDLRAATTTFQTLPLPPETKQKLKEQQTQKEANDEATDTKQDNHVPIWKREPDIVLPLLFEALMDVTIEEKDVTVTLRAPGTISGIFSKESGLLTYVEVKLDTDELVSSMVQQARLVVFKAVAKATEFTDHNNNNAMSPPNPVSKLPTVTSNEDVGLHKALSSALKLSKILHSKPSVEHQHHQLSSSNSNHSSASSMNSVHREQHALTKNRKVRSVTWNHVQETPITDAAENYPAGKRRRMGMSKSNLVSTRSFGRPNRDSFENPRNATFSEFGHVHQNQNVPAFDRHGKLHVPNAYHKDARLSGGMAPSIAGHKLGGRSMGELSNVNAAFDVLGPSTTTSSSTPSNSVSTSRMNGSVSMMGAGRTVTFAQLKRSAVYRQQPPIVGTLSLARGGIGKSSLSQMPRTATALENMFLTAASRKRTDDIVRRNT